MAIYPGVVYWGSTLLSRLVGLAVNLGSLAILGSDGRILILSVYLIIL